MRWSPTTAAWRLLPLLLVQMFGIFTCRCTLRVPLTTEKKSSAHDMSAERNQQLTGFMPREASIHFSFIQRRHVRFKRSKEDFKLHCEAQNVAYVRLQGPFHIYWIIYGKGVSLFEFEYQLLLRKKEKSFAIMCEN